MTGMETLLISVVVALLTMMVVAIGAAVYFYQRGQSLQLVGAHAQSELQGVRNQLDVARKQLVTADRLQQSARDVEERTQQIVAQRAQAERDAQALTARLDALKQEGDEIATLEDLRRRSTAIKEAQGTVAKVEQDLQKQLRVLQAQHDQAKAELDREMAVVARRRQEVKAELDREMAVVARRRQELAEEEQQLGEQRTKLQAQRREHEDAKNYLAREQKDITLMHADIAHTRSKYEQEDQLLQERVGELKNRTRDVDSFEEDVKTEEKRVRQQQQELVQRQRVVNEAIRALDEKADTARERRRRAEEELAATERRLKIRWDGRLICDQCWNTYSPEEVLYVPRTTIGVIRNHLTDAEKKSAHNGFQLTYAHQMLDRPALKVQLGRERPDLTTPQSQIEALFDLRCPSRNGERPSDPQALHRPGIDRLTPAELNWSIPVIGNTGTGKTTYVVSLLHRLHSLGDRYGVDLEAQDTASQTQFRDLERELFFEHRMAPNQMGVRHDIVYRIGSASDPSRGFVTLFFRDMAGESWRLLNPSENASQFAFLINARAFVFLIDPLADPELSCEVVGLSPNAPQRPLNEQAAMLDNINILFREAGGYNERVPKDALLVITKADLIPRLYGASSEAEYDKPVTLETIQARSQHIRSVIKKMGTGRLYQQISHLERKYRSVTLFAVSSLGHTPMLNAETGSPREGSSIKPVSSLPAYSEGTPGPAKASINPQQLQPVRVEDPIVWSLYEAGVLR